VIAIALPVVAAFNLVCAGTMRTGPLGLALPEENGAPFEIVYRIDMDARLWCAGDCQTTEMIYGLTDTELILRERNNEAGGHFIHVERATGHFTDTAINGNRAVLRSGMCTVAPFTGFPLNIAGLGRLMPITRNALRQTRA
jgi:hypothetical protein